MTSGADPRSAAAGASFTPNFAMALPVPSTGAGDDAAVTEENPLAARVAAGPGAWEGEE